MGDLNVLTSAPDFNPHRQKVAAADSATLPTSKYMGVNSRGFDTAVIDVSVLGGALANATLGVAYWSDDQASFVYPTPLEEVGITGPSQFVAQPGGRRFFIYVKVLTLGAATGIDVNVSGQPALNQLD